MIELIIKYKYILAGVFGGLISGFLFWKFVGCSAGTCAIYSVWYNSTLYGGLMGGLAGSLIQPESQNKKK